MSTLKVDTIESKTLNGDITVSSPLSGSGASLTNLPAANLTGTVADARISTLTASKLTGALPAISGASLTGISGGKVLQVVSDVDFAMSTTSSTSWAATNQYLSITPSATSSKILIMTDSGICYADTANATNLHYVTLYRDSTHLAATSAGFTGGYHFSMTYNDLGYTLNMTVLDSPSSTSSLTYTVYHRSNGHATQSSKYGYGGSSGSITLMEIGA